MPKKKKLEEIEDESILDVPYEEKIEYVKKYLSELPEDVLRGIIGIIEELKRQGKLR